MRDVPSADEGHCESGKNNNLTIITTVLQFLEESSGGAKQENIPIDRKANKLIFLQILWMRV